MRERSVSRMAGPHVSKTDHFGSFNEIADLQRLQAAQAYVSAELARCRAHLTDASGRLVGDDSLQLLPDDFGQTKKSRRKANAEKALSTGPHLSPIHKKMIFVNFDFFRNPKRQYGRAHPGESKYALRVIGGAWGAELRPSTSREIYTQFVLLRVDVVHGFILGGRGGIGGD